MSDDTQSLKYDNVQLASFARLKRRALYERTYFASSLLSYHNVALLGNVVNEPKHFSFSRMRIKLQLMGAFVIAPIVSWFRWASCPTRRRWGETFASNTSTGKQPIHALDINRTRKHNGRSFWNLLNRKHAASSPSGPSTSHRTTENLLKINR